jgi:hypothetical protein
MDPLITNGIDSALVRIVEKRGQERDPLPQRKRPAATEKPDEVENSDDENKVEPDSDVPKHTLDDLA